MVGKLILAVSLAVGGWFGAGVAHAEYIQNLGTYAGDVVKQLQDWGYNVMLNGLDRDMPIWMRPRRGIARFSGFIRW